VLGEARDRGVKSSSRFHRIESAAVAQVAGRLGLCSKAHGHDGLLVAERVLPIARVAAGRGAIGRHHQDEAGAALERRLAGLLADAAIGAGGEVAHIEPGGQAGLAQRRVQPARVRLAIHRRIADHVLIGRHLRHGQFLNQRRDLPVQHIAGVDAILQRVEQAEERGRAVGVLALLQAHDHGLYPLANVAGVRAFLLPRLEARIGEEILQRSVALKLRAVRQQLAQAVQSGRIK
jgi:hypothetical protein